MEETKSQKNDWLKCFIVVDFDIEEGQKIEKIIPSDVTFSAHELNDIAFSSFPDTTRMMTSNQQNDSVFVYRIKRSPPPTSSTTLKYHNLKEWNDLHYYGFVFFRQQKDKSQTRGYLQKAVVIISENNYVTLFKKMISIIGDYFFHYGFDLLETSFISICDWPDRVEGKLMEGLPILGNLLSYQIPYSSLPKYLIARRQTTPSDLEVRNQHLQSINIFTILNTQLNELWKLWELVLTNQPIIVFSTDPQICSDAVLSLISLISPLNYGGDYKPYYTIYDSTYKQSESPSPSSRSDDRSSTIIGTTNPFFLKLNIWTNILSLLSIPPSSSSPSSPSSPSPKKSSSPAVMTSSSQNNNRSSDSGFDDHGGKLKDSFQSHYKELWDADYELIKKLIIKKQQTNVELLVNNELIRRHFAQRTEHFLRPLEHYFYSLLPADGAIYATKKPKILPFSENDFLSKLSIANGGIVKTPLKAKQIELYRRFIHSPNFRLWIYEYQTEALKQIRKKHQSIILREVTNNIRDYDQNSLFLIALQIISHLKREIKQNAGGNAANKLRNSLLLLKPELNADNETFIFDHAIVNGRIKI